MRFAKICRVIAAVLLIAVWLGYAALNLADRLPYLQRGFRDGWDAASRINGLMAAANGGVLFQTQMQDANALFERRMDQRTSNRFLLVRAENGQYMYSNFYTYESYDFRQRALQLREAQNAAEAQGATFLFLGVPDLYIEDARNYGSFPVANLNARLDAFLYALGGSGVNFLDARTLLMDSPLPPSAYRYRTEPHWTTEASFEVYLGLVEWMKSQDVAIDPRGHYTDRANYRQTVYPDAFVGDLGKRVGVPHVSAEDFTLITPGFTTDLSLEYPQSDALPDARGDFTAVLLDDYWLNHEDPYIRNPYQTYLTADYPDRVIHNHLNANGPRILIIGDSSLLPVATFLSTAASEVHLLWPYSLPDAEHLVAYLQVNPYDSVLVGLSPGTLDGSGFNFLAGIEYPD